jgi:hypothetical protein
MYNLSTMRCDWPESKIYHAVILEFFHFQSNTIFVIELKNKNDGYHVRENLLLVPAGGPI